MCRKSSLPAPIISEQTSGRRFHIIPEHRGDFDHCLFPVLPQISLFSHTLLPPFLIAPPRSDVDRHCITQLAHGHFLSCQSYFFIICWRGTKAGHSWATQTNGAASAHHSVPVVCVSWCVSHPRMAWASLPIIATNGRSCHQIFMGWVCGRPHLASDADAPAEHGTPETAVVFTWWNQISYLRCAFAQTRTYTNTYTCLKSNKRWKSLPLKARNEPVP